MRCVILAVTALSLSACVSNQTVADTDLPFFGDGYRDEGDQCRRIGEDDFTNQFLDDAADLVGCPEDMENLGVFIIDTGAVEVGRKDGFILYSVPVR
ncbi:hypothetical protein [uncultured Ruegeria sp.]|uniref:hypothetical protein n=1 Tax=uncultured Ruegeria sp. TaxID=259304 RepID=UPI00261E6745|nr:hypothetical protein [uncultured Ruegeria sp.]